MVAKSEEGMKDWDKCESGVVCPLLYPVSDKDVLALEAIHFVPEELKTFWAENGSGFFNDAKDGSTILEGVVNKVLGPDEIVAVLETGDTEDFAEGLPFFEMNDCIYLLIASSGRVFANDTGPVVVVSASLQEFTRSLMLDPGFYIPLLGDD